MNLDLTKRQWNEIWNALDREQSYLDLEEPSERKRKENMIALMDKIQPEKRKAMAQVNDHGEIIDDGTRQPLKDPGPEPPVDELLQRLNPHDRAAWTSTEPQPEKPDFRDLCERLVEALNRSHLKEHYSMDRVGPCLFCDLISEATKALAGGKKAGAK